MLGSGEAQLGVGQKVAEAICCLQRSHVAGEVSARALRVARRRLRLVADQQRREVERRDCDITNDELGNDDRAVGNDITHTVRADDDEIAAVHPDVAELGARRKGYYAGSIRSEDLGVALAGRNRPLASALHEIRGVVARGDVRTVRLVANEIHCPSTLTHAPRCD